MDKKLKIAFMTVLLYFSVCIIRLMISDSLAKQVENAIEYEIKDILISIVESNNLKMIGYYGEINSKDKDVYELMGNTTSYLQYIKNENNNINIKVYDPNQNITDKANLSANENYIYEKETSGNTSYSDGNSNEKGDSKTNNSEINNSETNNSDIENDEIDNKESQDNQTNAREANSKAVVYSMEQLSNFNFLMNNMYVVTERANLLKSDLVAEELLAVDCSIEKNSDLPQILIYHTHSHEDFVDTEGENTSNIVAVGEYLAKILSEKYGYNVIHCTESFDEVNGVFDRSKAYTYATPAIEKILENNPSIEVILDLHRDGLPETSPKLVTTINGKPTAKIMFFNGISRNDKGEISYLRNPYRHENLALSFQMKLKALELYPDFTRNNYIDAYMYNLHLRPRSMLVEVGAQTNTFEEAKNAMEPFADILNEILQK